MGRLTESMQGLREAIKRQENQLANFVKNGGFQQIPISPIREPSDEDQNLYILPNEDYHDKSELQLHGVDSETSQASHWSCSLETINSSIGDLKHVLKNQDKQVIRLITESEELKTELKKKEKDLRKQKFLLKAERETFEQYRKDTLDDVKRHKSEENQEIKPDKTSQEIAKLKSELFHYRQLYVEQHHTVNRLSKLVQNLKDDKLALKDKLLQQEKRANKFILEMGQRFEVSRKEFSIITTKKFETSPVSPRNLAVIRLIDRNARLAYDNSMLKLELNTLKQQLLAKRAKENKLSCLTTRSAVCTGAAKENFKSFTSRNKFEITNDKVLKSLVSEKSDLTNTSNKSIKVDEEPSVTTLIERNFEKISTWQQVTDKILCENQDPPWDCMTRSSDEVSRTVSAPQLCIHLETISSDRTDRAEKGS